MLFYVYKLYCPMTGELLYIGRSMNPEARRRDHQKAFLRPMVIGSVRAFHTLEHATFNEIEAIELYCPRLNQRSGGAGSGPHTDAAKHAISLSKLGKKRLPFSDEWKAKMGRKGVPKPEGHGAKVSAALKQHVRTPEHVANLRAAQAARKLRNQLLKGIL